jgi:hypothetical protein
MYTTVRALGLLLLAVAAAGSEGEVGRLDAADEMIVEHYDPLAFVDSLSLKQVVDATFENYPQGAIISALRDEASALNRRTNSLIAGYPMIYLQWIDDRVFSDRGQVEVQTGYQIPFWMWGQRDASRAVANEAEKSAGLFGQALKHEVLLRNSVLPQQHLKKALFHLSMPSSV